jgi:hypothetical protein
MSFNNYKKIADVLEEFSINYDEANFIQKIQIEIEPYFKNRLELTLKEAIVFNSEYAICENLIYPILFEIWQHYREKLVIWSHQPLNYDEQLSGIPDYIIANRSPQGKIIFEKPYFILVEAKKDNFEEAWGQCLAELVAAQKINNNPDLNLFGVVSNGKFWEFGQLKNDCFQKNNQDYSLYPLEELFAALNYIFQHCKYP